MKGTLATWGFWLCLALILLGIPIVPFAVMGEVPGVRWLGRAEPGTFGFLGAALLAGDIFLPVPSSVVSVFIGTQMGWMSGSVVIAVGMTLGSTIGYFLAYFLGYPFVRRFASSGSLDRIRRLEDRSGTYVLAIVRAVPVLAEASVLAAGATRYRPLTAQLTLGAANLLLAILYATAGDVGYGMSSPTILFLGAVGLPGAAIAIVGLLRRHRPEESPSGEPPS